MYQCFIRYSTTEYILLFSGLFFILLMVSCAVQNLFILTQSHLCIFFCFPCPRRYSRTNIARRNAQDFSAYVSSRIFMVLSLTFKSLIHFQFIHVYVIRSQSSFIFSHICMQFPQHYLLYQQMSGEKSCGAFTQWNTT